MERPIAFVASSLGLSLLAGLSGAQTPAEASGLEALRARLIPGQLPTGAGVRVAQVEQLVGSDYAPDPSNPQLLGITFVLRSGPSHGFIPHATSVGRHFYGLDSLAPGISPVDVYTTLGFAGAGWLNWPGGPAPLVGGVEVLNNSWSSNQGELSNELLRRMDRVIETQHVLVCSTVGNGSGPLPYPLMSHLFNGLVVGRSDGLHHSGLTAFGVDGPGRSKPDLVSPGPVTSFAAPLVCGAGALLLETARTFPTLAHMPDAERPAVLKAALMAGARHRSGWTNGAPTSEGNRGATSTPLDPVWGVDELDVDRSHWILTGGKHPMASGSASAPVALHRGWAHPSIAAGESLWLRFEVARVQDHVSIVAAWNRSVADGFASWSMPNLELELWRLVGGAPVSLVGNGGLGFFASGNVRSTSAFDNVEHLYVRGLAPGSYLLELRRTADELDAWHVGLAWELAVARPALPGRAGAPVPGPL